MKSKGFTLIELLVVISIISVLSALLMANFIGVRQRGRDAERKSDLRQIQSALELYRADAGGYPDSTLGEYPVNCGDPINNGSTVYMQELPCDPLSSLGMYEYTSFNGGQTYQLSSCIENNNDPDIDSSPTTTCQNASMQSVTYLNP